MNPLRASGQRLAAKRRERGLSQEALAQVGGVTRQAIGAIEAGRAQPGVTLALAVARALNSSVEELFGGAPVSIESEVALPAGQPVPQPGQRVVVSSVGSRRIVRQLGAAALEFALEPAGAVVVDVRARTARMRLLGPPREDDEPIFVSGCDLGLGLLVRHLNARRVPGVWFAASNRQALAELASGRTHVGAVHGPAADRLTINAIRRFDIAHIEEGWLVARGNPHRFRGAKDLTRKKLVLANRPAGAGARIVLDAQLRRAAVDPRDVLGYERELAGHLDIGRAIAAGYADAGIGIASAAQLLGLDFIPLQLERTSLLVPERRLKDPGVIALVETLRTERYRLDLEAMGPYDTRGIGEEIA